MTNCLYITSLQYHLLVDIHHVREVLELDDMTDENLHGSLFWRGSSVPVRDLRKMMGEPLPQPPRIGVVYGENDDKQPVMLLCDKVYGILRCEESGRLAFPEDSGRVSECADSILAHPKTGQLLFHLKQGIFE